MTTETTQSLTNRLLGANLAWVAAGALLAATPSLAAQAGQTGVSVPQPVISDSSEADTNLQTKAKPSAAVPLAPAPGAAPVVYGAYTPYRAPGAPSADKPFSPDASLVTTEGLNRRHPQVEDPALGPGNPDAGIITHVETHDGEIDEGSLIKARLRETVSTLTTQPGSRFSAEVSEPVMQDGRVYLPTGSVVEGRITWVSGGKRIGGRAAIHMEPQRITLPDGTVYTLHARIIDTSSWQNTTVDREGTIIRKDHIKGTLEAGGLAAGGAMAAGALIAGPPGALIGAGVGAGATAILWFKEDRQAQLPKDLEVIFSLTAPLSVTPARAALPSLIGASRPGGE